VVSSWAGDLDIMGQDDFPQEENAKLPLKEICFSDIGN
jgi:hypothetical protein